MAVMTKKIMLKYSVHWKEEMAPAILHAVGLGEGCWYSPVAHPPVENLCISIPVVKQLLTAG